jgi:hypothetical protein
VGGLAVALTPAGAIIVVVMLLGRAGARPPTDEDFWWHCCVEAWQALTSVLRTASQ